jgi:hypothetical protein
VIPKLLCEGIISTAEKKEGRSGLLHRSQVRNHPLQNRGGSMGVTQRQGADDNRDCHADPGCASYECAYARDQFSRDEWYRHEIIRACFQEKDLLRDLRACAENDQRQTRNQICDFLAQSALRWSRVLYLEDHGRGPLMTKHVQPSQATRDEINLISFHAKKQSQGLLRRVIVPYDQNPVSCFL